MLRRPEECHILVVDDDSLLCDVIASQLEQKKFKVSKASGGAMALQIVKSKNVDLVVSDIQMPNGDGVSLLEQLRIYNSNKPQVILISGYCDISEQVCLDKGAFRLISKPFSRDKLMDAIMAALAIHG